MFIYKPNVGFLRLSVLCKNIDILVIKCGTKIEGGKINTSLGAKESLLLGKDRSLEVSRNL